MYGINMVGLHGYALLHAYRCSTHEIEFFTEYKAKNESTLAFDDVEPCFGSDGVLGDIAVYYFTVLKICSRHSTGSLGPFWRARSVKAFRLACRIP